jgi:hypothetical protein
MAGGRWHWGGIAGFDGEPVRLWGEYVTWLGAEWLQQVGADREMLGTMSLPDGATVAEIELSCRHSDLNLSVTGAPSATPTPEPRPHR